MSLGVVIAEDLKWEPHVQQKLKSALVIIKCIIRFIPKSEYTKICAAFISCLTWGTT